jgi:hypothetical protein
MSVLISFKMQKRMLSLLSIGLLLALYTSAQDSIPLLQGTVSISIKDGTFDCDFILSNIPRIKNYFIRINSGMNILNFRSLEPNNFLIYFNKSLNDTMSSGESIPYYFADNTGKGKFLPDKIEFKYTGKYPVVKDTIKDYSVEDWKGNIAFNGYSVRADGMQSAWFPVLYDIDKDFAYYEVKYDIIVNCKDCNNLFINGSTPKTGNSAKFKSDVPVQPLLFCGNYKVVNSNGTYVLNPDINETQIERLGKNTNWYKNFYEEKLRIPYKKSITYIHTTPTSKGNAFSFITYPAIVNIGWGKYGLEGFADENEHTPNVGLAHELGHYYFGSYKVFNSELGDAMTEGFATYLSFKAVKARVNDSTYKNFINSRLKGIKDFVAVPFGKIKSATDYHNRETYSYNYSAFIFLAIEKEIGQQKMWDWLHEILVTKTKFTNYSFLEQTLDNTLKDKNKLDLIKSKYFYSDQSVENIEKELQ